MNRLPSEMFYSILDHMPLIDIYFMGEVCIMFNRLIMKYKNIDRQCYYSNNGCTTLSEAYTQQHVLCFRRLCSSQQRYYERNEYMSLVYIIRGSYDYSISIPLHEYFIFIKKSDLLAIYNGWCSYYLCYIFDQTHDKRISDIMSDDPYNILYDLDITSSEETRDIRYDRKLYRIFNTSTLVDLTQTWYNDVVNSRMMECIKLEIARRLLLYNEIISSGDREKIIKIVCN